MSADQRLNPTSDAMQLPQAFVVDVALPASAPVLPPEQQMLAAVSQLVGQAANQWGATLVDAVSQLADRHLRRALKAAAIAGLADESATLVALQMARTDALKLEVSFKPIEFVAFRSQHGVVAQGQFDVSTLRVRYEGPAYATSMEPLPAQPLVIRNTPGVPLPSPQLPQLVVQNVMPPPAATKQQIKRDAAGEIESIVTEPA